MTLHVRLCDDCRLPLCHRCAACIVTKQAANIPMVLCNDNFWGYTTELLFKYKVRWLEAAIVSPVWTSMMVCYVEGDGGHLLNEDMQQQQFRTRVRGTAHSVHMPWEDIVEELRRHCLDKEVLNAVPRTPECLKYILRVNLRIDRYNMAKVLRQLSVRPFVLLQLLYFLIDQHHEAFRGKKTARELREDMRVAVAQHYPLNPAEVSRPEEEREWHLPASFVTVGSEEGKLTSSRQSRLLQDKHATPDAGSVDMETCLSSGRPASILMETSTQGNCDVGSLRANAVARAAGVQEGVLQVQTGKKLIPQWHGKYFSQILPFVIPFMVSGPDFEFSSGEKRWRRKDLPGRERAPWVAADAFLAGFARRVESQCRQNWTALPIMRTVIWKYLAETTRGLSAAPFLRQRDSAANTAADAYVKDAQALYEKLWNGHQRFGNLKIPIAGDTTRLQCAEGLTPRQRHMARTQKYLAENMPGTGAVRKIMAHRHWGARVNFGDCLFFTISPNEHHSALVLKLSRVRRNDPCLKCK